MTTKAKASKGTVLKRGSNAIGEVTSISGPSGTLATVDVTSHDSLSAEFVGGMPDAGEVSFDFNFIGHDEEQQGLEEDRENVVLGTFSLILNDHATTKTTYTFSAYVTAFSLNPGGPNDKLSGSCTLKITGKATKTYAPAPA
jgi:hypothetical protein